MKKISIIFMFVALAGVIGCSTASSMASNSAAAASGTGCAQALIALNKSKQTNGSVQLSNPTDLSNMLIVATAYSGLKNNKTDAQYKKSFTQGLIAGGGSLITTANATSVTNALLNATGLDGVNTSNIAQKAQTVSTIITLLNALK